MAKLENKNTNNENQELDNSVEQKKTSLFLKIINSIFFGIIGFVLLVLIAINLPITKRFIANEAIKFLNKDLNMKMALDDIEINFFGDVIIKGLKLKDYNDYQFVTAKELKVDSDWFALAFNTRDIKFDGIRIVEPNIKVITYKGDSISNFIRYVDNFSSDTPSDPTKPKFRMNMKVDIINGIASIVNQNSPGEAGKWLDARNVNLHVTNLKVVGPEVFADIRNFSLITNRYGKDHFIDTFSTNFELTDQQLKLGNLTFNTDHSLLQGEVALNLDPVTGFSDFSNKVKWDLKLDLGSQISGYDLSYFVTDWDNYVPINISGKMKGPLNRMDFDGMVLRSQDVNLSSKNFKIIDVLEDNLVIQSKNISADFTYKGLKASLPTFISSKLGNIADDFGRLKYNGSIGLNPKTISADGNLITGIGQAQVSNFKLSDYSSNRPKFSGLADVKDLNVTALTNNKQVGLISGKFDVLGEGFDINTMYLKTKSQVNSIELLGKEIHNVSIEGVLNKMKFDGSLISNDANAQGDFKGNVDFSTKKLSADFDVHLKHVNLNYFGVSVGAMNSLSGDLKGKFSMVDLNDLHLDTDINNLVLNSGDKKLNIPDSQIKAFIEDGNRIVSVDAPGAIDGKVSGKFDLGEIALMLENSINKIMVGNPPKKTFDGQWFDFDFDVQQGLVSFFVPGLDLPNGAKILGNYKGTANDLILEADAPYIKYVMSSVKELSEAERFLAETDASYEPNLTKVKDSVMVDSMRLQVNTAIADNQLLLSLKRGQYGENVVHNLKLKAANHNSDILNIGLNLKIGDLEDEEEKDLKEYYVGVNQTTNNFGDFIFRFEPTKLKINNVTWGIDTSPELDHSVTYRKEEGDFVIKNLEFFSDDSELLIKEAFFKSGDDFMADAVINNLEIGKLLALVSSSEQSAIQLAGIANGSLKIKKSGDNLEPLVDIKVDDIFMNGKPMGNLVTDITKSEKSNVFDVSIKALSSDILGKNSLDVAGTFDNNPSSPVLDINAKMDDFDLAFVQQFVKEIFGNFRGNATGDLKISGPINDIDYSGDIALKGFGLKLMFTGVDYAFDDTVINLSRGLALLNNIGVKDGRENSKGSISGSIQFETLSSMGVNLIMHADNLLVLNSTQDENDLFWGRIYGQGDVYVTGPVSGLEITTPNLNVLNTSTFTFNSASTSNVEEFKVLRFLKRENDGEIIVEKKKSSGANMLIDFDVTIDKGSLVNVLVGDDVGSISVRGDAQHLRFIMERSGNIVMNGSYIVDNGTFVSKAILERTFQIAKGSSIQWSGSPMAPDLNITANYIRTVTNVGEYLGMSNFTQPINVVLSTKITNTLLSPKIDFGVSATDVSSQVRETLADKMSNEDERVIQFGSILVLNNFNVVNSGGLSIDVAKFGQNTGYNLLFKQLGSVLNTISNEFQIDLDYIGGDPNSNTADRASTSVSFALSPRLNVKTAFGVPISKADNANSNYLSGEGTIEYDWSKNNNGSRLFRAYSKPSNIGVGAYTAGANQSYGIGVVYSRSFYSFKNLFKNKESIKKDSIKSEKNKADSIKNVLNK